MLNKNSNLVIYGPTGRYNSFHEITIMSMVLYTCKSYVMKTLAV